MYNSCCNLTEGQDKEHCVIWRYTVTIHFVYNSCCNLTEGQDKEHCVIWRYTINIHLGIIFDDNDRFRWKIYYCTFLEQMLYNYFICANFHLFWQTFTANVCPIIFYIFKEPMPRDLLTLFWSSHPGPYIFF